MSLFSSDNLRESGFMDDVQATIKSARCQQFDFTDKSGKMVATDSTVLTLVLIDPNGKERAEQYGVGRAANGKIKASKDGKTFEARPGQQMIDGFDKKSKLGQLIAEIANTAPDIAKAIDS